MSFKNIIKYFLCISLLVATPAQEANAQVGQAVKSATKTVSKWFGKKAAKETAEEVAEQGFKTISKEIAQKAITKNATNAIFDSSTKLSREALEEVTYTSINKTLSKKVSKEITEGALKITSKEFAQQLGKVPAREAQEIFLKKLGTEATQETYEQTAKKSMQSKAFDTRKSWSEKVKDKYHQLRLKLLQKIKNSKINKELLDIYAKGAIHLTEKELNAALNNPKYFRVLLKSKCGNKNVIEFLIRLKMSNPQYVKQILDNPYLWDYIKKSIRAGGKHEWLEVHLLEDFLFNPKWGNEGDLLALSLPKFSQTTNSVNFKSGGGHISSGRANSPESRAFHKGLTDVIKNSNSIEELYTNIRRYAKQHLTPEGYNEFLKAFDQMFEAA